MSTTPIVTAVELLDMADEDVRELLDRLIARVHGRGGGGIAVYVNVDFGHPDFCHRQFVSFGHPEAQIETADPPTILPDIGGSINWRYHLQARWNA